MGKEKPRITRAFSKADEGTRTLDLLHGNPGSLPEASAVVEVAARCSRWHLVQPVLLSLPVPIRYLFCAVKQPVAKRKAPISRPFASAGGGTRTPDTRIMIPLL
jgi:hypothetical protein